MFRTFPIMGNRSVDLVSQTAGLEPDMESAWLWLTLSSQLLSPVLLLSFRMPVLSRPDKDTWHHDRLKRSFCKRTNLEPWCQSPRTKSVHDPVKLRTKEPHRRPLVTEQEENVLPSSLVQLLLPAPALPHCKRDASCCLLPAVSHFLRYSSKDTHFKP